MNPRKGYTDTTGGDSAQNNNQRSDREHSGLRTLDRHESARAVYYALECQYAGVHLLQQKERQRAHASSARVTENSEGATVGLAVTADKERRGESGAGL